MGYKLKKHSGASKRFKRTGTSVKSRSAGRNHILSKQSTKRKRHNRGLNKLKGTTLKVAESNQIICLELQNQIQLEKNILKFSNQLKDIMEQVDFIKLQSSQI